MNIQSFPEGKDIISGGDPELKIKKSQTITSRVMLSSVMAARWFHPDFSS